MVLAGESLVKALEGTNLRLDSSDGATNFGLGRQLAEGGFNVLAKSSPAAGLAASFSPAANGVEMRGERMQLAGSAPAPVAPEADQTFAAPKIGTPGASLG